MQLGPTMEYIMKTEIPHPKAHLKTIKGFLSGLHQAPNIPKSPFWKQEVLYNFKMLFLLWGRESFGAGSTLGREKKEQISRVRYIIDLPNL